MLKTKSGFTIVELLIVIVVIAILAAITIVAYSGIQQRARDTRRVSDINQIDKALQRWSIETGQDFSAMPAGSGGVPGQGWYNVAYNINSVKGYLVSAGYLTNTVDDPIDNKVVPSKAYMIVECTTGDNKSRILLANMDMAQSQTIPLQLGSTSCPSNILASYISTYSMDYARLVKVD